MPLFSLSYRSYGVSYARAQLKMFIAEERGLEKKRGNGEKGGDESRRQWKKEGERDRERSWEKERKKEKRVRRERKEQAEGGGREGVKKKSTREKSGRK